jgi:ABC-type antimicrobial peptide transport system permease subunit
MALGAQRGRVIRLVLREMAAVILTGVAAGVVAALYCGRFIEAQLFGVKASDLAAFLWGAGALSACSLGAALLPAWRASRLNPASALRQE